MNAQIILWIPIIATLIKGSPIGIFDEEDDKNDLKGTSNLPESETLSEYFVLGESENLKGSTDTGMVNLTSYDKSVERLLRANDRSENINLGKNSTFSNLKRTTTRFNVKAENITTKPAPIISSAKSAVTSSVSASPERSKIPASQTVITKSRIVSLLEEFEKLWNDRWSSLTEKVGSKLISNRQFQSVNVPFNVDAALSANITGLNFSDLDWGQKPEFNLQLGTSPRYSITARKISFQVQVQFSEIFGNVFYTGQGNWSQSVPIQLANVTFTYQFDSTDQAWAEQPSHVHIGLLESQKSPVSHDLQFREALKPKFQDYLKRHVSN